MQDGTAVETAPAESQATGLDGYLQETSEAEVDTQPAPSTEAATEPEEQPEAQAASEESTEDADAEYLPTEQEKVFPAEVLNRYAKRYGYTAEEVAADPRLARTLHDKINSDIAIAKASELPAEDPEAETAEVVPAATAEPTRDLAALRTERFERIDSYVKKNTDPEVAKAFVAELATAFDPKSGNADPAKYTHVLSKFAVNLVMSVLPDILSMPTDESGKTLLQQQFEQMYGGFGDHWRQTEKSRSWESVRSQKGNDTLPAYGTPAYEEALAKASELLPGFEHAVYKNPTTGQLLSRFDNYVAKSQALARIIRKFQPNLEEQAKLVAKGRQQATEAAKRSQAGQLGAGKSKGTLEARPKGNDDLLGPIGEVTLSNRLTGKNIP